MGAQLPDEVLIVAIEANRVYDFSEELSPAVEAAIPAATQAVVYLVDKQKIGKAIEG
jgi:Ni,Fe-hydrogenase maturation factor